MDPERWQRVKEVFHEVVESVDDRAAVLAEACAGDADLEREVASLLASHDAADGFIETPVSVVEVARVWDDARTDGIASDPAATVPPSAPLSAELLRQELAKLSASASETADESDAEWGVEITVLRDGHPLPTDVFSPPITLGALPDNDLVLNAPQVSGRHATVVVSRSRVLYRDHSTNGSFVDGQRVREQEVLPGTRVMVGPYELVFALRHEHQARRTDVITAEPKAPPASGGEVYLELIEPRDETPRRLELRDARLRLGRGRLADLRLEIASLSRLHAELSSADGTWRIVDLDSFNGTYVNGRRLETGEERGLRIGDRLRLGEVVLLVSRRAPRARAAQGSREDGHGNPA